MLQNRARHALHTRKNVRMTTGQLPPVYASPPVGGNLPPDNQVSRGKNIQYVDDIQFEYRSFIFNMQASLVSVADNQLEPQQLLGKSQRRRYLLIQNNSQDANIYLSFGNGLNTGLQDWIIIPAGRTIELQSAPNNEVNIYARNSSNIGNGDVAIVSVLVGSRAE